MKLSITQEQAVEAFRKLGGEAEVWWNLDPRSRVTAYRAGGTGRPAVSMQRRTLESLIGKKLLEATDAPKSRNGWLVWRLTDAGREVCGVPDEAEAVLSLLSAGADERREELAASQWRPTPAGERRIRQERAMDAARNLFGRILLP